eukprot:6214447-Pleurochrysis_carterae.AAC.1
MNETCPTQNIYQFSPMYLFLQQRSVKCSTECCGSCYHKLVAYTLCYMVVYDIATIDLNSTLYTVSAPALPLITEIVTDIEFFSLRASDLRVPQYSSCVTCRHMSPSDTRTESQLPALWLMLTLMCAYSNSEH